MMFRVSIIIVLPLSSLTVLSGLIRVRDNLQSQRLELSKQKPRAKTDENLVSEVSRLESAITLARDDLVCFVLFGGVAIFSSPLSVRRLANLA